MSERQGEAAEASEAPSDELVQDSHENIFAFVEIPKGSRNKYEYDEEKGIFVLDRVLFSSVYYPTDYGHIPETHAEDGDHLDVLVIVSDPTFPGCMIECRPLGGLDMEDEKGPDFKVLAVPINDPRFRHMETLDDAGEHLLDEIENFFSTYKLLEEKETTILGWRGLDETWHEIGKSRKAYNLKHPPK